MSLFFFFLFFFFFSASRILSSFPRARRRPARQLFPFRNAVQASARREPSGSTASNHEWNQCCRFVVSWLVERWARFDTEFLESGSCDGSHKVSSTLLLANNCLGAWQMRNLNIRFAEHEDDVEGRVGIEYTGRAICVASLVIVRSSLHHLV
ncbi:hypothetical protein QBC32DRAFT_119798 [Pseudoneurospora amorphoporcata]|uniref:Secreted protein n=1 Tax=Pseudoneurospora amorphoporcata TaxID=241081 RepID=A0AAN6SHG7_9PEZI|nr:hypothetical protein QBC32DRAFT_119798 [Pseudoneurospora amorphoporcata]